MTKPQGSEWIKIEKAPRLLLLNSDLGKSHAALDSTSSMVYVPLGTWKVRRFFPPFPTETAVYKSCYPRREMRHKTYNRVAEACSLTELTSEP